MTTPYFLPFFFFFFSFLMPVCLSSLCFFVRAAVICLSPANTCSCFICILPYLTAALFVLIVSFHFFVLYYSYLLPGIFLACLLCSRTRYVSIRFLPTLDNWRCFGGFLCLRVRDHIRFISLGWRIRTHTGYTAVDEKERFVCADNNSCVYNAASICRISKSI